MDDELEKLLEEIDRLGSFADGFISDREAKQLKKKFSGKLVDMVAKDMNNSAVQYGRVFSSLDEWLSETTVSVAKGAGRLGKRAAKAAGNAAWEFGKDQARQAWDNLLHGDKTRK